MRKWKYTLKISGRALRKSIQDSEETLSSCIDVMKCILECLAEIQTLVSPDAYSFHFEDLEQMVREYQEEFQQENDSNEAFYTYAEDCVNECLRSFYDECDSASIWIGI